MSVNFAAAKMAASPGEYSDKGGSAAHALDEERQDEHAQHPAVEQRPDLVHRYDQCAEAFASCRQTRRRRFPRKPWRFATRIR